MMKRDTVRTFVALVLFLAPGGTLWCGDNTVYNFLRNDVGARAAALAGSFNTIQGDPDVMFYNPAGLASLESSHGSVGFFKHLLDINAGHLSYSTEFDGIGRFGAGILFTNYGTFDETDLLGNTTGSFGANDIALSIAYALPLDENLFVGGAVKFIYSGIGD